MSKGAKETQDAAQDTNVSSKEMLEVFAKTGHETLKALLLVSAGSVVVLLPFFGSIICSDHFPATKDTGLADSFQTFINSLFLCLCCYGAAFTSHACYYYRWRKTGFVLTLLAVAFGVSSIAHVGIGGKQGYSGLKALVMARAAASEASVDRADSTKADMKPSPGLSRSKGAN